MKINSTFLISATFAALVVVALSYFSPKQNKSEIDRDSLGAPMSIGGDKGPMEMVEWEFNRLKDPATGTIPYNIRARELAFAATLPSDAVVDPNGRYGPQTQSQAVWSPRGPWNVGGRTRAFGIDITDTTHYVAGSTSGGMWKTNDRGQTWARTFTNQQYKSITCLKQDKRATHTGTWYAGSGEAYGASASAGGAYYIGDGMWKSIDGGNTWSIIPATSTSSPWTFNSPWDIIWDIALDTMDHVNDVIYSANYQYIYKSSNGGTSWTNVIGGSSSTSYFTDVATTDSGIVYATLSSDGSTKGIFRSSDQGLTWADITPVGYPTTYNRVVIGVTPGNNNQVWFLGNTPGFGQPDTNFLGDVEWNSMWKYTYLSGNGTGTGGHWSDRSLSLPTTGGLFDKFNCQGSYDLVVKVHPSDTNIVFIGGTNLYRSNNGFVDATQTTFIGGYQQGATLPVVNMYANHHPDQHGLEFMPGLPNTLISFNDGGIFKTTNDLSNTVAWSSLNDGYVTSLFYTVAVDHGTPNNDVVIGGAQDNGSWFTNNATYTSPWVTPRGGDGSYCQIANGRSNYYFSIQNGKMMKSTLDGAGNVTGFARIDPIGGKGYEFINPFILDPNNNNIMYMAGGKRLWRNDDLSTIPLASNWDSISTNWINWPDADTIPFAGVSMTAVTVSKTPANRVYYGTSAKKIYRVDNANVGTPTPVDITSTSTTAAMPSAGNVGCIATNPNNADEILVVYTNYGVQSLFYSTSGGLPTTSWTRAGGNIEGTSGPSVRWAVIMPVSNGKVYMVGTSTGVYATDTIKGASTVWVQQGAATIGNSVCDMIDYRQSDGLVIVATHSHGMFSTHILSTADIVTVRDLAGLKSNFELNNYPNPFGSSTTITYTLSERSNVKLTVFDVEGKLIKTLMNEVSDSGKHGVEFSKGSLASGVYYINLQVGEMRETRKILVIE